MEKFSLKEIQKLAEQLIYIEKMRKSPTSQQVGKAVTHSCHKYNCDSVTYNWERAPNSRLLSEGFVANIWHPNVERLLPVRKTPKTPSSEN